MYEPGFKTVLDYYLFVWLFYGDVSAAEVTE
jgi:hypothetical protein